MAKCEAEFLDGASGCDAVPKPLAGDAGLGCEDAGIFNGARQIAVCEGYRCRLGYRLPEAEAHGERKLGR